MRADGTASARWFRDVRPRLLTRKGGGSGVRKRRGGREWRRERFSPPVQSAYKSMRASCRAPARGWKSRGGSTARGGRARGARRLRMEFSCERSSATSKQEHSMYGGVRDMGSCLICGRSHGGAGSS